MNCFEVIVDAELEPLMARYFEIVLRESAEMQHAVEAESASTLAMLGHRLKGSGCSYGLQRLTELGAEIEDSGLKAEFERASELILEVRSYLNKITLVYKEMD